MDRYYDRYWKNGEYNQLEDDLKGDFKYKWPIIEKLIPKKPAKILDFGCGNGAIIRKLAKISPGSKFVGIDISSEAIRLAAKANPRAKFFQADDGGNLPLKNGSMDFVLAADVIEHVYDTDKILDELHRILKKSGRLLITTPYLGTIKTIIITLVNFELIFDPRGPHIRFYTKKSLLKVLTKAGFKIERFGYFGRFYPISNGMYVLAKLDLLK